MTDYPTLIEKLERSHGGVPCVATAEIRRLIADNEALRKANLDCVDHYNDCRAEAEALRTQVAELGKSLNDLYVTAPVGWQPTCKQDLQVLFPRHTPHRIDNWTIAPAFLTRVLHTIAPDTPYDFIPTMEQVEQVLLAIEVIPTAEYIAAPAPVAQRVEALVMPNDDAICEALIQCSDVDGIAYDPQSFEAGYKRGKVDALDSQEEQPIVTREMLTAAHGVTLEGGQVVLSAELLERIYLAMRRAEK